MENALNDLTALLPRFFAALPAATAILIATILLRLATGRVFRMIADRTSLTHLDIAPFAKAFKTLITAGAIVLIFGVFGFNLGGLWAMLATVLGMIAIGFVAVWSLLSNMSSAVLILFLKPFQVGDDIEFAGEPVRGRVVDLNFFYVTLLDSDGYLLQLPNNLIFQKTLRRSRNEPTVSLAFQLNSPSPANLPPPPPAPPRNESSKVPPPNPLMSVPDPATIMPPSRPNR